MVNERRIRDRIALAADARERAGIRAEEVRAAVADIHPGTEIVRGALTLRFESPVTYVRELGVILGVECHVRAFIGGVEQSIDGHRRIVNPPTLVPDGTTHTEINPVSGDSYEVDNFREDAREAFLVALEQSILAVPR